MHEESCPPVVRRAGILALAALCLVAAGCGEGDSKWFDYGEGKINLERITFVSPRLRIGIDEMPFSEAAIDEALKRIEAGHYAYFHVEAVILFDEFAWTAYKSGTFEKEGKMPTAKELRQMRRELIRVLKRYREL